VTGYSGLRRKLRPPPGGEQQTDERSSGRNSGPWDRKLRPGADTPAPWAGNSGPHQGLNKKNTLRGKPRTGDSGPEDRRLRPENSETAKPEMQ